MSYLLLEYSNLPSLPKNLYLYIPPRESLLTHIIVEIANCLYSILPFGIYVPYPDPETKYMLKNLFVEICMAG